ncbi:hypothetical protein PFICI_06881 [Pestalotiopsis fici W106-1]|uniref:ZZ-type domain-containing protein n=1 Tax=Pestalotiopsis fici (strain W106-1 / CGMCC3.15140) TaxID=1229662 RepID=W3X771_PESFW|nr:uncharacterized protein PFICI_06881 [Pestalotiopsis fici W106-1]ETS81879.1 hypothetical protein PFICI_06881 [Pestalotiopsis fici W106-1]
MASSAAATPDTPITLKISFAGVTRRYKLPLRELVATTLEHKLRGFLHIQEDTQILIERYSDSAATYVVLDSTNPAVYKQLFRAAKAKQKLKLRVLAMTDSNPSASPKPVTVEDEAESSEQKEELLASSKEETPASITTSAIVSVVSQSQTPGNEDKRARSMTSSSLDKFLPVDILEQKSDPVSIQAPILDVPATETSKCPCPPFSSSLLRRPFTVCCNSCDRVVPDAHFHCSTCDDGDFDLCQDCVNQGISCYNDQHWLIKRTIMDDQITYSTTHVAPKTKPITSSNKPLFTPVAPPQAPFPVSLPIRPLEPVSDALPSLQPKAERSSNFVPLYTARTCNSCVQEFPEKEFLHCLICEDFDLCKSCFTRDQHGHHPKHAFTAAVKGTSFDASITARLNAGRNARHNAICDGCNHYIRGVRHKCLDCPDWDYCSDCAQNAGFVHPNHRFAPIYEPLPEPHRVTSQWVHNGICCDGPLCTSSQSGSTYIVGVRYKCAVCHDTDFCASCEASPANTHNKTHPLIKFKTPVRHVNVTTTGEHQDGKRLPVMGDRNVSIPRRTSNRSTETVPSPSEKNIAVNPVQTVVDVKPTEAQKEVIKTEVTEKEPVKVEEAPVAEKQQSPEAPEPDLIAVFRHDTIEDGTIMPPNHTFEQTWVLRNEGKVAWPAGCSVKFVGGDYMGAIDPTRPTGVRELISASESTVCYNQLQPGQEFPFTVLMRTPERDGKVISYWRLTTRDGVKYGHKLWCDVTVQTPQDAPQEIKEEPKEEESLLDAKVPEMTKSQMILPKLDHESPDSSVLVPKAESELDVVTESDTATHGDEFDEYVHDLQDEEWVEESEDGYMTDEEYEILDASDEEYLYEQQRASRK